MVKSKEEAADHFGFLGQFVSIDVAASRRLTQEWLGWRPTQTNCGYRPAELFRTSTGCVARASPYASGVEVSCFLPGPLTGLPVSIHLRNRRLTDRRNPRFCAVLDTLVPK